MCCWWYGTILCGRQQQGVPLIKPPPTLPELRPHRRCPLPTSPNAPGNPPHLDNKKRNKITPHHGGAVSDFYSGEAVREADTALAEVTLREGHVRVRAGLHHQPGVADGGLLPPLREEDNLCGGASHHIQSIIHGSVGVDTTTTDNKTKSRRPVYIPSHRLEAVRYTTFLSTCRGARARLPSECLRLPI